MISTPFLKIPSLSLPYLQLFFFIWLVYFYHWLLSYPSTFYKIHLNLIFHALKPVRVLFNFFPRDILPWALHLQLLIVRSRHTAVVFLGLPLLSFWEFPTPLCVRSPTSWSLCPSLSWFTSLFQWSISSSSCLKKVHRG